MPLIVVYNPICGDGTAKAFFDDNVLPLLSKHGRKIDKVVPTMRRGHAGEIVSDFLKDNADEEITVILGSGDGTLHEIVNFLSDTPSLPRLHVAVVPCGTANALFTSLFPPPDNPSAANSEYKLQSVKSYIHSNRVIPLTLAIATLPSSNPSRLTSCVVMSTSLHACILRDSETLRNKLPGIERFKVAAMDNATKWYNARVRVLPTHDAGKVQVYDPASDAFVDHPDSLGDDPTVHLEGPFAYFLSTVNVDRLEPMFQITPLARTIPPAADSCDLVILRPLRDPSTSSDYPQARQDFAPKLWRVLTDAYKGQHVKLRYNDVGDVVPTGNGLPVVEYMRCGGWEWIPEDLDKDAHLLCSDGTIVDVERGSITVCIPSTPGAGTGFAVYA